MFCRSLFVLFLLVIVLSVLLRFTDSDYPLVSTNLFLEKNLNKHMWTVQPSYLYNISKPLKFLITHKIQYYWNKRSGPYWIYEYECRKRNPLYPIIMYLTCTIIVLLKKYMVWYGIYLFTLLMFRKPNKTTINIDKTTNFIGQRPFDSRWYFKVFQVKESFIFRYFKVFQVKRIVYI
jgi:hypothetical protein